MRGVFAAATLLGVAAIVAWALLSGFSGAVGSARWDPETLVGKRGGLAVAAVLGFGIAGMSAAFAGWHGALAFAAAISGAVVLAGMAALFADDRGRNAAEGGSG